ncbi:hypothetical protein EON65_52505 [archaeon]|nr:MAG: hypothetical protein EON65_52505 [archaeon]
MLSLIRAMSQDAAVSASSKEVLTSPLCIILADRLLVRSSTFGFRPFLGRSLMVRCVFHLPSTLRTVDNFTLACLEMSLSVQPFSYRAMIPIRLSSATRW